MKLGIFSKVFKQYELREAFARIKELGLSTVQFNFTNVGLPSLPDNVEDSTIEEIKNVSQEIGIEIPVISGTFNTLELNEQKAVQNIKNFKVLTEAACKLGIPNISISTGSFNQEDFWSPHPENHSEKAWGRLYESLDQMIEIVSRYNITIVIEPEQANVVSTVEDTLRLLNHYNSPNLKVLFDAANIVSKDDDNQLEEKIKSSIDALKDHIAIAHLKDCIVTKEEINFASIGKGNLPLNEYVSVLGKYYDGPIIMHGLEEEDVQSAIESIEI